MLAQATNKEQNVTIQGSGGLSDADIEKMVREAADMAARDKAKKEVYSLSPHMTGPPCRSMLSPLT